MVVVLTKCINERTLAWHFTAKQAPIYPLPLKENSPPPALAKIIFVSNLVKVAVNIQKIYFKITIYLVQSLFKKPPTTNIGKVTYIYMCYFKTDRFHNADNRFWPHYLNRLLFNTRLKGQCTGKVSNT